MDHVHQNQLQYTSHITSLYYNQTFPINPISSDAPLKISPENSSSNPTNKQLEPITLHSFNRIDQPLTTQYVMTTTVSHLSFTVTSPTYITIQPNPFLILLRFNRRLTRTEVKIKLTKYFILKGLRIQQQANAYFYFLPSSNYKHIFLEEFIRVQKEIRLKLIKTPLEQYLYIPNGALIGTLQPVLLSKHLTTAKTTYVKHS